MIRKSERTEIALVIYRTKRKQLGRNTALIKTQQNW